MLERMTRLLIIGICIGGNFLFGMGKDKLFLKEPCRDAYLYHFLMLSCNNCDKAGVEILLSQGADINGHGYKNYPKCVFPYEPDTPLIAATIKKCYEIVELLLKKGADPNIVMGEGESAVVFAVRNQDIRIVKLLLKYGAKIEMKDLFYKPMDIAKKLGNKEIIRLLQDIPRKEPVGPKRDGG